MTWESPKLGKNDVELITLALEDHVYYSKQDGMDVEESEKILLRLNDHLQRF
jgi:hypothetical protein